MSMTRHKALQAAYDLDRRAALKLLGGGGLALTLAACGKPAEEIVPYVDMPERLVPGEPLRFATTLPLSGYGRGVLATSIDGRPIKIEGNPHHPASLGATDVFAEAEIMSLYDPGRSQAPRHGNDVSTWDAFAAALRTQMEMEKARQGAGLRIVTGRITSPTLSRQIKDLLQQFPAARWYAYEAVSEDTALAGSVMAYGRPLTALPRIADAAVVLALDADPLGPGPQQVADAQAYAQRRRYGAQPFLRLYTAEPEWTLTGANSDHRVALRPDEIRNIVRALASLLQGDSPPDVPAEALRFAQAVATDLKANSGRALIMVGPRQPADVHALALWLNAQIKAPIDFIAPIDNRQQNDAQSLQALASDLESGAAKTLLIVDANPAYDTPAELGLAQKIAQAAFSVHLGLHDDETAERCRWHLPLTHPLESWSDLRAFDGTASIVQPLIRPLYDSRGAHDFLALAAGQSDMSAYQLVRQTWQTLHPGNGFDAWWKRVLHDGVIANSAAAIVSVSAPKRPDVSAAKPASELMLSLAPDLALWDGRFANNAWLQECPHPFTKDVWGNSIQVSETDSRQRGIADGDVLELRQGNTSVRGPARIREGQAAGVVAVALGHGRTRAGAIGNGVGFDAYALRTIDEPWQIDGVTLAKTGARQSVPTTQHQFALEGEAKDLYPILTLAALAKGEQPAGHRSPDASLYPKVDYDSAAWAMVIDTSLCIGCNACVVACQAENNVPVVGPEEIARGRDMHWLRIDRYTPDAGKPPGFQPVPCMHCEKAPCEPVCPVAASVHDGEGLNVQVYNRCIGTRFCQANCPYKVRRFNWFGYADGQEYTDLGKDSLKAASNPDVTVRQRGVMEKCTYCVQRISRARRNSEKDDRAIGDGEVVTACQSACPTRAITFGDKNNAASAVNAQRAQPHHYALLGHLGTRPRTTYLARLRNPNSALQEPGV
jgi:molybdopterin-containing oxidoreductase family iron-sulfur binding subunit